MGVLNGWMGVFKWVKRLLHLGDAACCLLLLLLLLAPGKFPGGPSSRCQGRFHFDAGKGGLQRSLARCLRLLLM